jgi:hypothetical protein
MNSEYLVPILTVLLSFSASVLGSWLVFRAKTMRIGSQNVLDESTALEIQMRINKENSLLIKDMQTKYSDLYDSLKGPHRLEISQADFDMGTLIATGTVETTGAVLKIKKLTEIHTPAALPTQ